jgi:hypothetical protein
VEESGGGEETRRGAAAAAAGAGGIVGVLRVWTKEKTKRITDRQ